MTPDEARQLIGRTIEEVNAHSRVVTLPQCESTSRRILEAVEKTSNHVLRVNESVRKLSDEVEGVRLDVQVHLAQHRGEDTGEARVQTRRSETWKRAGIIAAWLGASAAGGASLLGLLKLME